MKNGETNRPYKPDKIMSTSVKNYKQKYVISANSKDKLESFKDIGLLIQNTSTEHSIRMGLSITALQAANLTWVLVRQQYLLLKLPEIDDEIEIETWPSALTRFQCRRDFTIRAKNGEILGHSLTSWAIVNMQTRRAERIPEFISSNYPTENRLAMPKLPLKPTPIPKGTHPAIFTAKVEDIDINNHVTNTRYVDFMLDAVPNEIRKKYRPLFFDITYRAESLEGDQIESKFEPTELKEIRELDPEFIALLPQGEIQAYWHNLVKMKKKVLFITKEDEKELVRGFSLWVKE